MTAYVLFDQVYPRLYFPNLSFPNPVNNTMSKHKVLRRSDKNNNTFFVRSLSDTFGVK